MGHVDTDSPAGVQPVGQASGWTLTMSEEFNGSVIDEDAGQGWIRFRAGGTVWRCWYPNYLLGVDFQQNFHTGNPALPEKQIYVREGVSTSAGSLLLTATRNVAAGRKYPQFDYVGGNINSHPSFGQAYGFWEAKMKLPGGLSSWPAFWMFPITWVSGGGQQEIDIMECFETSSSIKHTYWYPKGTPTGSDGVSLDVTAWHTYALKWTTTEVRFYVDGTNTFSVLTSAGATIPSAPMFPILNLAMRPRTITSEYPATAVTEVDYVRVWAAA